MTTNQDLELLAVAQGGRQILLSPSSGELVLEQTDSASRLVIDLSNNQITIYSPGDIQFQAGGKIQMSSEEGVEINSSGDVKIVSESETIVRGKMVRIN